MAAQVRKTSRGRQKIEMKKIENDKDRMISFSKRKAGIMKKAAEISIMCGAKAAFIIFSSAGKAYSFGHPSVKFVIDKFMNMAGDGQPEVQQNDNVQGVVESNRDEKINELAEKYNVLVEEIESEKRRVEMLQREEKSRTKNGWWEQDINKLELGEAMKFHELIENFKNQLTNHMKKLEKKKKRKKTIHQHHSSSAPPAAAGLGAGSGVNQMKNNSSFMENTGPRPCTDLQLYPSSTLVHPSPSGPPLQQQQHYLLNQSFSFPYGSSPQVVQHPQIDLFNSLIGAGSSGTRRIDPPGDHRGGGADEDDHRQNH